jgi:23S rRNA-/tRNA-specific pseudouridylate synthase
MALGRMFQTKTIKKKYMALVVGLLKGCGEVTTKMDGRTATSTCVSTSAVSR